MRGAFRSEPKFLAEFTNVDARRYSVRTQIPGVNYQVECEVFLVRTEIPGDIYQSKCGVSVCRNKNSQQYVSV